jgi:raffinose/stachyose/melibiose transport system substrate-binding protein
MSHSFTSRNGLRVLAAFVATAAVTTGCSAGSLGSSDDGGGDGGDGGGGVELTLLADNNPATLTQVEALAAAFSEENPDISIEVESRPGGTEGDNLVKTRLSTGDMADVFVYNSGSLLQALNAPGTLVPLSDEPWVGDLAEPFVEATTIEGELYGAPVGSGQAGAVLYNKAVYEELGLEVPQTWDEFMANNATIAEQSEAAPVIQTYGETWTSQLFVLGDFHNVLQAEPDFAEQYTAGEMKYATSEPAIQGFAHQQEVFEAGYMNEDFASATYADGVRMLAEGEGVHYPMLTSALIELANSYPDAIEDIGVFGMPGPDAATHGITIWTPDAAYIPQTTEGDELEAAKELLAFIASPTGCEVLAAAATPTGPYMIDGCELPADVPSAVQDIQTYLDEEKSSPALEFLSPIKGPNLENLTVEVGSGIRSAQDAAALYDQDVVQQAQQLGLDWD